MWNTGRLYSLSLSLATRRSSSLAPTSHTHQSPLATPFRTPNRLALQERINELLSWHTIYYSINPHHPLDVRYLDNHFYYQDLLPYFNPKSYQSAFSDKNYYDVIFSHFPTPRTIAKRIKGSYYRPSTNASHTPQSLESTLALLKDYDRVLLKPTEMHATGQGSGIQIIEPATMSEQALIALLESYASDIAIQEVIAQHSFLESLQPNSVNTFRIMTLIYDGEVHLLSAFLAIGSGGNISNGDNSNRIGIDENGVLRDFLVKDSFILKDKGAAPDNDTKAESIFSTKIPHFDEIINTAKAMHLVLPHFGLIGWDFTLDSYGKPMMIEANLDTPGGELPQFCNAPLLGSFTDTILTRMLDFRF